MSLYTKQPSGAGMGSTASTTGGFMSSPWMTGGFNGATGIYGMVNSGLGMVNTGKKRGLYDTLDPVYYLADGKTTGLGEGLSDAGVALTKTGIPIAMIGGAALKVLGGLHNAGWGTKWNEDLIGNINSHISQARNTGSAFGNVNTSEGFFNTAGNMAGGLTFSNSDLGSTGWFRSNDKINNRANALRGDMRSALSYQGKAMTDAAGRVDYNNDSEIMRNYKSAFGGPLSTIGDTSNTGAIEYDFMDRYLTAKEEQNKMKNKVSGLQQMPVFMPQGNPFALGGDTEESAASKLARGWYDGTVGGFIKLGKAVYDSAKDALTSDSGRGSYGRGSFDGAGRTSRWKPAYRPENTGNFNEAFDEARNVGAETFMFGDKEYSTVKEANPVREFNNRHVGAGRTEELIRQRGTYGRDVGPLTGKYSLLPIIPYAFGGDMQTHISDFPSGLTHIDAGGSHSENPNEGVQVGVDREGVPNLVEEGETIWNDYVFSARIPIDQTTKELFHIGKKREMTYADLSKKLEKEIAERVNDPISKAGFEKQMEMLEEQQERQKKEMEAERAKAAFEALSPEEQTALMQQKAQQEAVAQQAMEQQAMTQQQAMQQPSPEELAMAQQQTMGDGSEPNLGAEPQVMAEGGNLFSGEQNGSSKMERSVGTWKDKNQNHWDVFTKPGLKRYIENLKQRLNMAPDDETKDAIRREAMNELNSLQQSYFSHVLPSAGASKYGYDEDILKHQQMFDRLYGNTGFYSTDENGNVRNLIAEAINLPNGAATEDKPENWADGYNGRRTSIRNYGSTEYGDDKYYQDLVDEFKNLGLTYAPNDNWKYGDNALYGLSIPEAEPAEKKPQVWDWNTGSWVNKPQEQPVVTPTSSTSAKTPAEETKPKDVVPDLKKETSLGLWGPAIGLGLMGLGVGKPDTASYDAAANSAGDVRFADYKPIGNYLTYRPLDIWYEQNALDAQSRATDRALMNTSGGNRSTALAGLLANGYNSQRASGNLFRQAQEYNDALRQKVEEFNRGTDQFNAEAYNKNSQFNAGVYNDANRTSAQMKFQAASAKDDANRWWASNLFGNINGLFDNIKQWEKWKRDHNTVAKMYANGLAGVVTEDTPVAKGYVKSAANGGKLKKKRGLTI